MKLLYITNGVHGSGGLERVLAVKTNELINNYKYDIAILTLNPNNNTPFYDFNSKIVFFDVRVSGGAYTYFKKYRKGINKTIREYNPDVVSVCDDGLKGLLFPILFKINIPIIYERHASIDFNFIKDNKGVFHRVKSRLNKKIMLFGAKKFDAFIVLTNSNKLDWPSINCTVIPNPSPFEVSLDTDEKENIVLAVGTQSYNKGYDRLIEAWKRVYEKYPNWKLKIFGKQNKNLKLQEQINSLKLNETISLHDPVKNIEEEYKRASIFVLSSRTEGFGMVLIEAMNFGVPCVSFDCPHGPKDIITDGEDGYLVVNNDIMLFSEKISNIIKDKEKLLVMGENAKKNVKRYSSSVIVSLWDELFKKLLK